MENLSPLEINKPRCTVEIANTVTLVQRKAFNCLMLQRLLVPKKKGEKYNTINIKELCHLTGYRQKDFLYLDKQLEEMQTTLIRWSDESKRHGRVQFLGHVEYNMETGILEYSFSEKLVDLVKANKLYNCLDFGAMREIQSTHALALYEMCAGYREKETYTDGTPWWHLDDLKVLLCGEDSVYPQFKIFNRDVLKPAIAEVNKVTDINIVMGTRKLGRKVNAVKFHVWSKEDYDKRLLEKPRSAVSRQHQSQEEEPELELNLEQDEPASAEDMSAMQDWIGGLKKKGKL